MKLDATVFRYITKDEFRVLTAVEVAMRNHELAPAVLIENLAKVNRGSCYKLLQNLLRNKLVAHDGKKYDGYRLTYGGYDFLALRALAARGTITAVGRRLGVGKESDVHFCKGANGETLALKLHRLGRISFRAIKSKRDYLQHRTHASWMYMARLAAAKEYAYMKALKDEGFPVPTPVDLNRHCIIMSFVFAVPLCRKRELRHPDHVLERLMRILVRMARAGIVHGDFNEFNLMIDKEEKITVIDFPQIVHMTHENAEQIFDRDVRCVCEFFRKRLQIEVDKYPIFSEVLAEIASADQPPALANALRVEGLGRKEDALLVAAHENNRGSKGSAEDSSEEEEGGIDEEADVATEIADDEDVEQDKDDKGFEDLLPGGSKEAVSEDLRDLQTAEAISADGEHLEPIAETTVESGIAVPSAEEGVAADAPAGQADSTSGSDSEDSEGPRNVALTSGKRTRRRHTAKQARSNLQKQQKAKPARPNNQKVKELRKAKHDIKEYING